MARIANSTHETLPWRIHVIAPDFQVEDVWSFRTPGAEPEDFDAMLAAIRGSGAPGSSSGATHALFALRMKLGALFGWDRDAAGLDARVPSLRERLPEDLRGTVDPDADAGLFAPVFRVQDEFAGELANRTVHTVMHLGWPRGRDGHELRMAVLVRPNGLLGRLYLLAILPFRHLVVYPAMQRQWERAWLARRTADGCLRQWVGANVPASVRRLRDVGAAATDATSPGDTSTVRESTDAVRIRTDVRADARTWASVMLGDALGAQGQWVWRRLLRLRLIDVDAEDGVAGWPIIADSENLLRLHASSRSIRAELVVTTADDTVTLATFVTATARRGRLLWRLVHPLHLRVTRKVLPIAPGLVVARQRGPAAVNTRGLSASSARDGDGRMPPAARAQPRESGAA